MKTATMRELLHNPTGVLRWVEDGETVTLTKRGKPIAQVIPPTPAKPRKVEWPDFAARARAYCGDVVLSDEDVARLKDDEERSFS